MTDPEIPVLNIVEMGLIAGVIQDGDHVTVELTPTFSGCPALNLIREQISTAVGEALHGAEVTVNTVYDPPWTSIA